MTTTHTPGPWVYRGRAGRVGYCVEPATSPPKAEDVAWVVDERDLALVVAAPELLKALENFAAFYAEFLGPGDDLDCTRQYREALAVIAKARGK